MPAITPHTPIDQHMRDWRHDLHRHPETAYEETRTAAKIAALLHDFGLDEIHTGLAQTGVVGVLHGNRPGKTLGLRADMDALDIHEANTFAHRSQTAGKMHACGHDGHTAMLLGAAEYLSATRDFAGSVVFIFQPAEENVAGGKRMCDEGLFTRFPVDSVYALHNWPELPAGHIAVHEHEVMASFDLFDIDIHGQGCHGAMPHLGIDSIAIAAQTISALQHIVSRNLDSAERAVVSVTQIHGGDTYNILPGTVRLSGGTRAFRPEIRDLLETVHHHTPAKLAAWAREAGVSRWLQLSALGADPAHPVAFVGSKGRGDEAVCENGPHTVLARPSVVYGRGGGSCEAFLKMARLPVLPLPDGGRFDLQPVHAEDVADGLARLLNAPPAHGSVIHMTGSLKLTLADYLNLLRQTVHRKPPFQTASIPLPLLRPMLPLANLLSDGFLSPDSITLLQQGSCADTAAFRLGTDRVLVRGPARGLDGIGGLRGPARAGADRACSDQPRASGPRAPVGDPGRGPDPSRGRARAAGDSARLRRGGSDSGADALIGPRTGGLPH